jgi:hypothetical protein
MLLPQNLHQGIYDYAASHLLVVISSKHGLIGMFSYNTDDAKRKLAGALWRVLDAIDGD